MQVYWIWHQAIHTESWVGSVCVGGVGALWGCGGGETLTLNRVGKELIRTGEALKTGLQALCLFLPATFGSVR